MIRLVDILTASGIHFDVEDTKIHLACWNGQQHPIDEFYAGRFTEWQEWQTQKNFECTNILSLIDLRQSNWMFAGVYSVAGVKPHPRSPGHYLYSTKLFPGQDDLIGRAIVRHVRPRNSYVWLKPEIELPLVEYRRERMTIAEFPGYNAVCISYATLQTVIRQRIASWYGALGNIKGIYLITDTSTGCLYVGKASGQVGLWQRWTQYAETGHGGNVKLRALLREHGEDAASNFQFTILEIADNHASEEDIQKREIYWTNVLKSREFGLN